MRARLAILVLTDRLIALEPENAEAYLERGGAYHHSGDEGPRWPTPARRATSAWPRPAPIARRHGG